FTQFNPLRVNTPGVLARDVGGRNLGVTLRDKFGNIAAGHPFNKQYFDGLVLFATSGSSDKVKIIDLSASTTTPNAHWFRGEADTSPGVFTGLQVEDSVVEELMISATAQAKPTIWGRTRDAGRFFNDPLYTPSLLSDDNVYTAGVVVFPTDLAPEKNADGTVKTTKSQVGQNRPVIRQGDGMSEFSPKAVQMLRLSMNIAPTSASFLTAQLSGLNIAKTGLLDPRHVAELALHSDDDGDGLFDGAVDVRIATAVLDAANGIWSFGDPLRGQVPLNEADPSRALLATSARNYFLALRMHATGYSEGELPSGMGLSIPSPFYVRLSSTSQVGVADNFFAIKTATSPIERE
ncbi:MAG: hypothetical protein AAB576_03695, partial [Elusimicrobiota bacterium]